MTTLRPSVCATPAKDLDEYHKPKSIGYPASCSGAISSVRKVLLASSKQPVV